MKNSNKIRIVPLGGMREVGKNLTVIEYRDDLILVDCGMTFPGDEMPGIDIVIPDISYLVKNKHKIRGMVITHGHEDHIGAIPYVLKKINIPVYGTKLTLGLIQNKLKEHRLLGTAKLKTVSHGQKVRLGKLEVEWIRVNHSIPDSSCLAIKTPLGTIVHSGDFKVDFTPISGKPIDLNRLGEIGSRGVLCYMGESTNVLRPGYTMSESRVGETFDRIFSQTRRSRIIIATFASNVHRIQQIINAAEKFNRKVVLSGRSMLNVMSTAQRLGYLQVKPNTMIDIRDMNKYNPHQLVLITTGSQGEPMSALTRISNDEHRQIKLRQDDVVILSAHPIPGNENAVSSVINNLIERNVNVIYESLSEIHVSGHACQEELKMMLSILQPKYFVPCHGEIRHLKKHAEIAKKMGINKDNVFVLENGDCLEISQSEARMGKKVPSGQVLVDGLGVGDVGSVVLKDRKHLSEDGLISVVVAIDKEKKKIVSGPDIISRGFVYVKESGNLMSGAKKVVLKKVQDSLNGRNIQFNQIKSDIRDELRGYLFSKTKRNPMILPIIMEVKENSL